MAKADLSDARASLDWADRQIDVLAAEIADFAKAKPYLLTGEQDANGALRIYIEATTLVPQMFKANTSAILQAQRASLDYLAVALAEANGAANPRDTYFPIVKTKDGLTDKRTLKKISALDPADQQRILDLKPYAGGNDTLYALHDLNIERKHRRLGVMSGLNHRVGIGGSFLVLHSLEIFPAKLLTKNRHLVVVAKFDGDLNLDIEIEVSFDQVPGRGPSPAVVPVLRDFGGACRDVLRVFE